MDNYKLNSTETPEKRAQIKILVIVGFIQLILTLVTEAYANFFLLIAVMAFAYLVANTDDFFLVWDSAKGLIEKYGKNIGSSRDNTPKKYEQKENKFVEGHELIDGEPIPSLPGYIYKEKPYSHAEQIEEKTEKLLEITNKEVIDSLIKLHPEKKDNNSNSVIWANNDNKSGNAGSNMQSNIQ